MLVGTHLRIGSFVYRFIISDYIPFSQIGKIHFKSGNILPDVSLKLARLDHNVIGASKAYRQHIRKVQNTGLTDNKRMLSMGVMCHFLCDFFCVYHAKESYKKQSILRHLFYELKLHIALLWMLAFPVKLKELVMLEQNSKIVNCDNFANILTEMQLEYHDLKPSIRTDIIYALRATLISTSILMKNYAVAPRPSLVFIPSDCVKTLQSSSC